MTKNTILLIDEVDAHLHPKLRFGVALRLKELLHREPGLSVILASHADEVIDSLMLEVDEPGIRKAYHLLETAQEEAEREEIKREAKFIQESMKEE